jgi:hypothetical protein
VIDDIADSQRMQRNGYADLVGSEGACIHDTSALVQDDMSAGDPGGIRYDARYGPGGVKP